MGDGNGFELVRVIEKADADIAEFLHTLSNFADGNSTP
jgi:hypothetical protein